MTEAPELVVLDGEIEARLPSDRFGVRTSDGQGVFAAPSGRLSRDAYLMRVGDLVTIELDLASPAPGRIVRHTPRGPSTPGRTPEHAQSATREMRPVGAPEHEGG